MMVWLVGSILGMGINMGFFIFAFSMIMAVFMESIIASMFSFIFILEFMCKETLFCHLFLWLGLSFRVYPGLL